MNNAVSNASAPTNVRNYLLDLMKERRIPGLQLAIVRDGKIECLDALGTANIEHQIPVGRESIFSINSIAKAVTGVAVMQLVEAGKLDLDATISTYLEGLPPSWQSITIRQLATGTSGLPEMMQLVGEFSVGLIGGGDETDAWQAVYRLPTEFGPGQNYKYGQTAYALLGRVIDRLSGKSFVDFIAENQFEVAGMSHTAYLNDRDIVANRANTYMAVNADGTFAQTIYNGKIDCPPVLRTAAGLSSTAEDLAKWIIALQNGVLLKKVTSLEALYTRVGLPGGRLSIQGIGWLVGISHAGVIPAPGGGCKAQIALYPGGLTVILVTNLFGALPEHFAPVSGGEIKLDFMDPIAKHYAS